MEIVRMESSSHATDEARRVPRMTAMRCVQLAAADTPTIASFAQQARSLRGSNRLTVPEEFVVFVVAAMTAADVGVALDELDARDPFHLLEPEL